MYRSKTPPVVHRLQFDPLEYDRKMQRGKDKGTPEARRRKLRVIECGTS